MIWNESAISVERYFDEIQLSQAANILKSEKF